MSIRAFITGLRRGIPAPAGMQGRCFWLIAGVIAWAWLAVTGLGLGADAEPAPEPVDDGVFLPTDRELERSLDKARRLLSDGRWSDAATLFDEILAAPRDAFGSAAPGRATSRSLKTEAWAALHDQPRAGRDAYELLFSARAERRLAESEKTYREDLKRLRERKEEEARRIGLEKGRYKATGWVQLAPPSSVAGAPKYKMHRGDQREYYIVSDRLDFEEYRGKNIGVLEGDDPVELPGSALPVMKVRKIEIINAP